jgi:hypothetical protein
MTHHHHERQKIMPPIDNDDEKKKIIKEAIDEWLDTQFASFGRWTFYGILSAVLAAFAYFAFVYHGFGK